MDKVKSRRAGVTGPSVAAPSLPQTLSPKTIRAMVLAMAIGLLAVAPRAALAQTALQATQIVIGAPAQSNPGAPITVQALLTDSQGHPISKAVIYFTTQESFLHGNGDVVLAQAMTSGNGQAVAQFLDDFSGTITLQAEFRGDAQYAPSDATTPVATVGEQQVYAEHVGVDIPGLTVPPVSAPMASIGSPQDGILGFIASLWPAMNGWPLAAILLLVWSMYLLAVRFVLRVAALGSEPEGLPEFDSRRQS